MRLVWYTRSSVWLLPEFRLLADGVRKANGLNVLFLFIYFGLAKYLF